MAIMIVMIHVGVCYNCPLLRCAVPIFFIISSYFFFFRINNVDEIEAKHLYYNFIKRACKLYTFWFIILLPYMIITNLLKGNIGEFLYLLPINLLFRSTFPASWYIAAYIIGISLMFIFRKHNTSLLIISLICYIICCCTSNYGNLVYNLPEVNNFLKSCNPIVNNYIKSIYLSFPVGLVFIWIGKVIAENEIKIERLSILGIVIGGILLYLENKIIVINNWRIANDCYFSMLILAPSLFLFILYLPNIITFETSNFRKMSTIYYCSHIPSMMILMGINKYLNLKLTTIGIFVGTMLFCTATALLFIKLAKLPKLEIFKYSY